MSRGRVWVLIAALCGCSAESGGPPDAALLHSVVGTCASADGRVQVRRVGLFYWESVEVGTTFRAGDWVRTAELSTARIEFLAGSGLEVLENTTVIVDAALLGGARERPIVTVEVGATRISLSASNGPIGIKNADGSVVQVEPEKGDPVNLRVEREGGADVRLAVSSGLATVRVRGGEARTVRARQTLVMSKNMMAEPPAEVPVAPTPEAPGDGERLIADSAHPVELRWSAVERGVAYRYQIARDAAFRSLVGSGSSRSTRVEFAPSGPGAYFWRVAGRDAEGRVGEFSNARTVVVERERLVAPESGAVVPVAPRKSIVEFSWAPGAEGARYRLVVSKKADLSAPVAVVRTSESRAEVKDLKVGAWFWGVFEEGEGKLGQKLFAQPYKLTLRRADKNDDPRIRAPQSITWE